MDAMNTSALSSGGGHQGASPHGGNNYRKAFKPNLPSSSQNGAAAYEPERRSPNVMPRNLSHS